jgi:myo-inositol 2-dehydrogenase/D-chiro-inositol 1-dehydrogenase
MVRAVRRPPLGIGVIGCGTIANSAYLPAIRRLRDRLRLVAVADVREEQAARAAREYGAETYYTDYRQLLARPDIAIVDICTPERLHGEQVVAAAEAGKHILCEKPMTDSLAAADAMLAAARRAEVKFMVGHSRRFTPRYRAVRAAIDRGDIGEVRLVRENERRPRAMYDVLRLPSNHWAPEGKPWLSAAGYTLGAAMTNAVHETDLLRWYAGAEAASVYAESRVTDPDGEVPDFITITIRFRNGALGATEIVNRLPHGYPYYHHLEVFGTGGLIRADDPAMVTYSEYRADTGLRQPLNFGTLLHVGEAYVEELRALADAVSDDTPVPLPPEAARAAVALALAAVQSSAEGRVVQVDDASAERRTPSDESGQPAADDGE